MAGGQMACEVDNTMEMRAFTQVWNCRRDCTTNVWEMSCFVIDGLGSCSKHKPSNFPWVVESRCCIRSGYRSMEVRGGFENQQNLQCQKGSKKKVCLDRRPLRKSCIAIAPYLHYDQYVAIPMSKHPIVSIGYSQRHTHINWIHNFYWFGS